MINKDPRLGKHKAITLLERIPGTFASHLSPEIVLEEMRNVRGMSPRTQKLIEALRRLTGELPLIERAAGTGARVVLPKHDIQAISQKILKLVKKLVK
jgi:hypothetical protein